jgi:group I intron endonuclease
MACGIYGIENKIDGKTYVGKSVNMEKRWIKHANALKKGTHYNTHLQRSYNKYGKDCFSHIIIEQCEVEKLSEREQHWVNVRIDRLYNHVIDVITMKGSSNPFGNRKHSTDTKNKMSVAKKGKYQGCDNPNYGNVMSLDSKLQMVANHPRIKLNAEQVVTIRQMLREGNQTHKAIAALFGVSRSVVTRIGTGNRWSIVKEHA